MKGKIIGAVLIIAMMSINLGLIFKHNNLSRENQRLQRYDKNLSESREPVPAENNLISLKNLMDPEQFSRQEAIERVQFGNGQLQISLTGQDMKEIQNAEETLTQLLGKGLPKLEIKSAPVGFQGTLQYGGAYDIP